MAVRLRSRHKAPVGGFIVNIPQINFNRQFWRFSEAVAALWECLQGNPGVHDRFPDLPRSKEACEDYIDSRNASRMLTIKGAEDYIFRDDEQSPKPSPPQLPKSLAAAVGASARRIAAGAFTLISWLGNGGVPVHSSQAEVRAQVCCRGGPKGTKCPQNVDRDLTSVYTVKLANVLRQQLQSRKDLNLTTSLDGELGICDACACPLKLKVHVDIAPILSHMPEFVRKDLPPHCWILREEQERHE